MNPFRSRKKSFAESGETNGRPSLDKTPPLPSTGRGRPFFRKKSAPEPKPELNIAEALPAVDDFRTSMLMPNLSARFSMLREQDDPNSKIGKANDDSVLFPKRSSRLNLFGHEGLSDIAEVSSISGSVRPPFANNDRANSYSSLGDLGYGTDDDTHSGSMMTRAKPGMGNKLFGGRQKVYKIPVDGGEDAGKGKAVYEDDITMSAFQILRAKEKQNRIEAGEYFDDVEDRSSREQDRRGDSPPLAGYNRKRETSSSTNSGPMEGRTSTAATSIASQGAPGSWYASTSVLGKSPVTSPGAERPGKGKRLYGQGLDQQMLEQQTSALSRLNSIQRGQSGYGATIGISRSASNLNDRFRASAPFNAGANSSHSGAASPSGLQPAGLGGFDFGVNEPGSRSQSKDREGVARQTPPMSPLSGPIGDPTLMAALDANDLGKATASGVFNKPKTPYNEQQFAQRQLQLQEGRETPPLRSYSRTDNYGELPGHRLRNGSMASVQSAQSMRNHTQTGSGSRAPSAASNPGRNHSPIDNVPASAGAFLADGSEYGSGLSTPELPMMHPSNQLKANQPTIYENEDQQRSESPRTPEKLFLDPTVPTPTSSATISLPEVPARQLYNPQGSDTEGRDFADSGEPINHSDTVGNGGTGAGLSDLVRGHLRNPSNQSATSIYPDDDEEDGSGPAAAEERAFGYDSNETSTLQARARQVLAQANQLANGNSKVHDVLGGVGNDKVQQVLGGEAPRRSAETSRLAWQEQIKSHVRGPSADTQKEREDFANELADRRRGVLDNLRTTFVDDDSSSASPTSDNSSAKQGAIALLKKASLGSLNGKSEQPAKAMKMLGLGSSAPSSSRPSPTIPSEPFPSDPRSLESRVQAAERAANALRNGGMRPRPGMREGVSDRGLGAGNGERRDRFVDRNSPGPQGNYERSASEGAKQEAVRLHQQFQNANAAASGLPRAHADEPSNRGPPPMSYHPAGRARKYSPPSHAVKVTPDGPRPDASSMPGSRSNSAMGHRPGPPKSHSPGSYFASRDHQHPHQYPSQTTNEQQQQSSHSGGQQHRPAPMASPFSAHATPPLDAPPNRLQFSNSGASSPITPTVLSPTKPNSQQQAILGTTRGRKQSVNKQDISEPTFLSGTSSVITVDLPPGASLNNGMAEVRAEAPPVPPINPNRRRRIPVTQNVFTAFGNKYPNGIIAGSGNITPSSQTQPSSAHSLATDGGAGSGANSPWYEERSTFGDDYDDLGESGGDGGQDSRKSSRSATSRSRLRQASSGGEGNSNVSSARARHQALLREAETLPPSSSSQQQQQTNNPLSPGNVGGGGVGGGLPMGAAGNGPSSSGIPVAVGAGSRR